MAKLSAQSNESDLRKNNLLTEKDQQVAVTIKSTKPQDDEIKASKKRYLIMALLMVLACTSTFQVSMLMSMTNFISIYYGVSHLAINSLSFVGMSLNFLMTLPITVTMERIGLRASVLIGSFITTSCTLIKCLSYRQDGFGYVMIASILMVGQLFFMNSFSRVAVVWFPENQLARANSMRSIAMHAGFSLGYLLPTRILGSDPGNIEYIEKALLATYGTISIVLVIVTIALMFLFDEEPKFAPSTARSKQIVVEKEQRFDSLMAHLRNQLKLLQSLLEDRNFCLLLITYSAMESITYSFHIILNQIFAKTIAAEQVEKVVGDVGLFIIAAGLVGSFIYGYALDKYRQYKLTVILVYLWSIVSITLLFESVQRKGDLLEIYIKSSMVGVSGGFTTVAYRYANEITFPKPELLSSTLLFLIDNLLSVPVSLVASILIDNYGHLALASFYLAVLFIGLLTELFQRGELKRQNASINPERVESPDLKSISPPKICVNKD